MGSIGGGGGSETPTAERILPRADAVAAAEFAAASSSAASSPPPPPLLEILISLHASRESASATTACAPSLARGSAPSGTAASTSWQSLAVTWSLCSSLMPARSARMSVRRFFCDSFPRSSK